MSNLIVMCQGCLSWTEPISDMCPECGLDVDLDRPDLDQQALNLMIGTAIQIAGPVRIERRSMPSFGHLIVTTTGLLFLPRLHRRLNGSLEPVTSQRVPGWWPFQGEQSSPRFLAWLRRPVENTAPNDDALAPILETESEPLADRLIETPGGLFISRASIRNITARRKSIQISRTPRRSVVFVDETENSSLMAVLNSTWED